MCGIAGCITRSGNPPSMDALVAMREALVHRGPDDSDVIVAENVGLVHTRLSIVDISKRAHQPMRHPNGTLWLSFNGEIFNHQQLRSKLGDVDYTSMSDTETLLHAFDRWGTDVLSRLNGQFAFGAVDLDRGRVTLARDRFGIKPLYLLDQDDGFWFASEPGALYRDNGQPFAPTGRVAFNSELVLLPIREHDYRRCATTATGDISRDPARR